MKEKLHKASDKRVYQGVFLAVMMVMLSFGLNGQTLPYFHGFEDATENAQWQFQNGSAFSNPWVIGTAAFRMGTHGLYVSHNGGTNAAYVNTKGASVAYRTFTLPGGSQYEVDFDWKCLGNGTDELYVCWVTNPTENVNAWANNNNGPGSGIKMYGKTWTGRTANAANPMTKSDTVMSGFASWQHGSFTVAGTGQPAKLVFFWTNSQATVNNPGACIDNVQINRRNSCPKPTNLTFTLSTVNTSDGYLTWSGNGQSWDVMYKNENDASWTTHSGLSSRTDTITGLTKGLYTFYVRSNCGSDTSSWAVLTNVMVYTTMANCIDYLDLHASNVVCTYGIYTNPFQNVGIVDNGSAMKTSRHTVHYGVGEYDRQTGNQLPTVPPGEVASVRLGNWNNGSQAESITYTFTVDSSAAVFLLKYAIVLEDPRGGHTSQTMPKFKLDILDMNNQLVDPACGAAEFTVGDNTSGTGWHRVVGSSTDVLYKEWTTVGLNLMAYAGQQLKARLTTFDCNQTGHYGYAYFTLDCAKASLEGETCGGAQTATITAPPGFVYEWFSVTNPSVIVSNDRNFSAAANDTSDYICRVIFAEDPLCNFELRLELTPKWPVSDATFTWNPNNCRNIMEFNNTSYVANKKGVLANQRPSSTKWIISDGRESTVNSPKLVFPNRGGTFLVTLVSGMAEDQCQDSTFFTITVPPLMSYDSIHNKNICEGGSYAFNNKVYTQEGFYSDTMKTYAGCDSIISLNLRVFAEFTEHKYDTICDNDAYDFHGKLINVTGVYVDTLASVDGCDSIVTLHLQVNPVMTVVFDPLSEICADDPDFTINFTPSYTPTHYAIRFGNKAQSVGFVDQVGVYADQFITVPLPQPCVPDYYDATIQFLDSTYLCGDILMPFNFAVLYPDSIIKQKFNNVLSLRNENYNGGFHFSAYQWYKNGNPLPGETGSYMYLGENNSLNSGDHYRVMITRADGTSLMSCDYVVTGARPQISVMPLIVGSSEQIRINITGKGVAKLWSTGGILLRTEPLLEGGRIVAPREAGVYILQVITDEGDREVFRIVVSSSR